METQNLKWHQKPVSVILLLIFFFPLGLYFMWKNKMWSTKTRWIVTSILLVFAIIGANNDKSSSSYSSSDSKNGYKHKCPVCKANFNHTFYTMQHNNKCGLANNLQEKTTMSSGTYCSVSCCMKAH